MRYYAHPAFLRAFGVTPTKRVVAFRTGTGNGWTLLVDMEEQLAVCRATPNSKVVWSEFGHPYTGNEWRNLLETVVMRQWAPVLKGLPPDGLEVQAEMRPQGGLANTFRWRTHRDRGGWCTLVCDGEMGCFVRDLLHALSYRTESERRQLVTDALRVAIEEETD